MGTRLNWEKCKYANAHKCQRCGKKIEQYLADYGLDDWLQICGESYAHFALDTLVDCDVEKHAYICGECQMREMLGDEAVNEEIAEQSLKDKK